MKRFVLCPFFCLLFATLSLRQSLPAAVPQLVKDINTAATTQGSSPDYFCVIGSTAFFSAVDADHGRELWKSDGTAAGTVLVKDIRSGSAGSFPGGLTAMGGTLYFTASDGTAGFQLWKSDGTAAGTVLVKGFTGSGSTVTALTVVGSTLFFVPYGDVNGNELWKTDGTAAGTVIVKDITPGSVGSDPSGLIAVGSTLFFNASDGVYGRELWKSDGTAAGTVMVKDIRSGIGSSGPSNLSVVGSTLYFTASDGSTGIELWKSDGTAAGTVLLKDILSGSGSSSPANLRALGSALYFTANDGSRGTELWKSDGTAAGTLLVKDILAGSGSATPARLTTVGSTLFFVASDATNGSELWQSDGTAAGTTLVKDIVSGNSGSFPKYLTAVGSTLYFSALTTATGFELWRSDGTAAGTVLVKDIRAGANSSFLDSTARTIALGGTLCFTADKGDHGTELWLSDGTAAGTVLVKDINTTSASHSEIAEITRMGGAVYFRAYDPANGNELWKSDGTAAGTVLVKDIHPGSGSSYPNELVTQGSILYFVADDGVSGAELWKSDGTSSGTAMVKDIHPGATGAPTNLTLVGSTLYFVAYDSTNVSTVWKSDGTESGTVTINSFGQNLGIVENLTAVGNSLYFTSNGNKLFRHDGSLPGSFPIEVSPFGFGFSISDFTMIAAGNTLFFGGGSSGSDIELWKCDSGPASLVKDINPGASNSSNPIPLATIGSTLYFTAVDESFATGLWKSDGTEAWTVLVKNNFFTNETFAAGSTLYFGVYNDGYQLWKSDGTTAGTVMVKSISPPGPGFPPTAFTAYGSTVYFVTSDGSSASQLWKSDGTTAGTMIVADLTGGSGITASSNYIVSGDRLLFTATTNANGTELWSYALANTAPDVTTLAVSSSTATTATLSGTVNPQGLVTTAQFEYGLTLAYGSTASVTLAPSDGAVTQNVTAALSGLISGATYHYRLSATNSIGTSHSADRTFNTPSDNANLTSLTLSTGMLNPAFAPGTLNYTVIVPLATASITLTPTAAHAAATVRMNNVIVPSGSPSDPLSLNPGSNLITLLVTAQDGVAANTYTVTVSRIQADIALEQPLNQGLGDGTSVIDFGGLLPGTPVTRTFTIRNTGSDTLTGIAVTLNGTHSADFVLSTAPATSLAPAAVTSFDVRFTAGALGARVAAMHVASSVSGSTNPFDVNLVGQGLTANQDWQQLYFGTTTGSGNAAPDADPNFNGIPNILEYALGGDPVGSTTGTEILPELGINPTTHCAEYSLTRYTDRTDITLTVQAADNLSGPWTNLARSVNGAAFSVLAPGAVVSETGSGTSRAVIVCDIYQSTDPAHPRRFMRLEVSQP